MNELKRNYITAVTDDDGDSVNIIKQMKYDH